MKYNPTDELKASSAAMQGIGTAYIRMGAMLAAMAEPASPELNDVPPTPIVDEPFGYIDYMNLTIAAGIGTESLSLPEKPEAIFAPGTLHSMTSVDARLLVGGNPGDPTVDLMNASLPIAQRQHQRHVLLEVRYLFSGPPNFPNAKATLQLSDGATTQTFVIKFTLYPAVAWNTN